MLRRIALLNSLKESQNQVCLARSILEHSAPEYLDATE